MSNIIDNKNIDKETENVKLSKNDIAWSNYYWNNFVLKYEEHINWLYLSRNPYITWNIIKDNPDKQWDMV